MEICKTCAECCKNYPLVKISKKEINSLEQLTKLHFGVSINLNDQASEGYLLQFKKNGDCLFLNEKQGKYSCDIYKSRPQICKNYPSNSKQQKACDSNKKMHESYFFLAKKDYSRISKSDIPEMAKPELDV